MVFALCAMLTLPAMAQPSPRMSVETSQSLFSVMAAINVCGYDADLAQSIPLRQQIRGEVLQAAQSRDAQLALRNMCAFYEDHHLFFGLLIGVMVPVHLTAGNDVPTMLYTPPEMTSAPFGLEGGNANGDAIVVEAVIDTHGRVEDYRVLNASGPKELSPEMKNALIFTQFRPATSFGVPTSGRVVISFSDISVGG